MPHMRFYTPSPLEKGNVISLHDEEFYHLTKVMRGKEGDLLEIVNGNGELAQAKVSSIEKHLAKMLIISSKKAPEKEIKTCLFQALCLPNKLDWIVEKATELGVDNIVFFPGKLSEKKDLSSHQKDRLEKISLSALKQSGKLYLPTITFTENLDEALKSIPQKEKEKLLLFGDVREEAPLLIQEIQKNVPVVFVGICIGPEKGLSDEEIFSLEKKHFAKGVKISSQILRTETASLSSLSIIEHVLLALANQ
jgi:16S rRNA (uracil1498-N3)-methyltransferase